MIIEGFSVERFFFALALALIASKILGELSERIKQPAVLGELLAGVFLGGSVLTVVPSTPGKPGYETFHLLGEVGVVILLFEIGLETDLRDLIRVGVTSTLVAVVGKLGSGWVVFKKGIKRSVIGVGMIPRGEVGLIFAQVGLTSGIFDSSLFSAVTMMVMLTTFICPPLLKIIFAGEKCYESPAK
ncbi:MAG: hypothetical protein C4291_11930 [Candidatus Dadabacteria bacterium]